jgi:hypothetical protein
VFPGNIRRTQEQKTPSIKIMDETIMKQSLISLEVQLSSTSYQKHLKIDGIQ